MKDILKALDNIDFHDIPVESLKIISDPEILVVVSYLLFMESLNSYQHNEIVFKGIEALEIEPLVFDSASNIEINSFEYSLSEVFDCKMTFLTGFGKSSFEMKIKCKAIELNIVPNQ